MGKKQNPLQARVKRMMQADVEVGKIAGPTPALISKALEMFLKELCDGASEVAVQRKQYVMHAKRMDFLKHKFAEVPDLPAHVPGTGPPLKPKAPKPKKRQRPDDAAMPQEAKAGKGGKDAPVIQQMPDSTPFTAPPVVTGNLQTAGSTNKPPVPTWGAPGGAPPAATAAAGDAGQELTAAAGGRTDASGAAQAVFAAPGVDAAVHPQVAQPVAAEEDDYDAD